MYLEPGLASRRPRPLIVSGLQDFRTLCPTTFPPFSLFSSTFPSPSPPPNPFSNCTLRVADGRRHVSRPTRSLFPREQCGWRWVIYIGVTTMFYWNIDSIAFDGIVVLLFTRWGHGLALLILCFMGVRGPDWRGLPMPMGRRLKIVCFWLSPVWTHPIIHFPF